MKRGDVVLLTLGRETVKAMVMLASENQRILMLCFEGSLRSRNGGIFPGAMPVLMDEDGDYREIVSDEVVHIKPAERL